LSFRTPPDVTRGLDLEPVDELAPSLGAFCLDADADEEAEHFSTSEAQCPVSYNDGK